MTRFIRIIPRMDIKGPNIVKGINAEGLRVIGSPKELAKKYYEDGADEILYMDIVASLYQRNLDFDLLKSVAKDIFIPLTVGGGIRSIEDINNALRAGADKIAINTYATHRSKFLSQAVKKFGSQCIVLSIEAKNIAPHKWEVYTDGGREKTGIDVMEWTEQAIDLGVGEILVTSIDQDGTRSGYDRKLIDAISDFSSIPVIAHGGAGSMESVKEVILETKCDAVSLSSALHYKDFSIRELKKILLKSKIHVRI
jgi:imidazole glycerol-phosphate synthase subunit HisF